MGASAALIAAPNFAQAASNLESDDFVGISFWLISMALVAATAFFFMETQRVEGKWKTSLTVSGLRRCALFLYAGCLDRNWIDATSVSLH